MKSAVKKLCVNETGRDFVLGDIHGAYDLVIQGMRQVNFNRQKDRLLVVGDLIDRGPGSHRVLEFLQQPYVHAVRGNHDHDFCQCSLDDLKILASVNWNGMGWIADVPDEKLLAIQAELDLLPVAMEVKTPRGTVGLVHADVPAGMDWDSFLEALQCGDEKVLDTALYGRDRAKSRDESGVPGIGRLYVGHTVQWRGPRTLGNVVILDTGGVFRELGKNQGALTMVNALYRTGVLIPADDQHVYTHSDGAEGPFGDGKNFRVDRQRSI
jgi:serine/threonine protein phosphatase 1